MRVSVDELRSTTRQAILNYGYTSDEANTILSVLMYAQLRGNNQGVIKLIGKGMPKNPDAGEIIVEKETKLSARINGAGNQGMVVMKVAVTMAVEKAHDHGFGIVGTNHTNTSTGAIGYYARRIAEAGLIGFCFSGSSNMVAYHGSHEAIFGTNPLAIGIPSDERPLVFDMATSAMAYFGLVQADVAGETIPDDVAYDPDGNSTTNPAQAMAGALRVFDRSFKGAALSLIVELLTGPLVSASYVGIGDTDTNQGNLFLAIDPDLLGDRETFNVQVAEAFERVRDAKRLPGVEELFIPGERGDRILAQILSSGQVEVEDNLWAALRGVAGEG